MKVMASIGVSGSMKPTMSVGPNAVRTKCISDVRARVALSICPMWCSSQKMRNTRTLSLAASAAACDQRSNRQRHLVVWRRLPDGLDELEGLDLLSDAVFLQLEVVWRQGGTRLTFLVEHGDVHRTRVCASAKDGFRRLLLSCLASRSPAAAGGAVAPRSGGSARRPTQRPRPKGRERVPRTTSDAMVSRVCLGPISESGQKQPEPFVDEIYL